MSDFMAKMHQIRFRLGLRPTPRWSSLQRSPRPLDGFKGPTSKEWGGEGTLDLSTSSFWQSWLRAWAHDKMRSGADLNGDNSWISRTYLRISYHRLRLGFGSGLGAGLVLGLKLRLRLGFSVANRCVQTAREGDKMRINHVIKSDQRRCAPLSLVFVASTLFFALPCILRAMLHRV